MNSLRHIEELRDMLPNLRRDAQFLYQYGELGSASGQFYTLSEADQKRLLYLALTEENTDVQNVARHLMKRLHTAPRRPEDLLVGLPPQVRAELMEPRRITPTVPRFPSELDQPMILAQLQKACIQIGFLEVEEAFWILIPNTPTEEVSWIEATGGDSDPLSGVRVSFQATYYPTKEEKYDLITAMRRARWVLHVHNHPISTSPSYVSLCTPSNEDSGSALHWKSVRPELASKIRFFVIQENQAVEYALPQGATRRWI